VILLIATFVFIMSLCGAVTATDSQEGINDTTTVQSVNGTNSSSNETDPRIHGVIRNNTTLANGAVINIRNPSNNSLIISGTTNSNGEYDIFFNSSLKQFKVEILFGGRNFTTTVTPTGTPIPTAELNHTFVPTKMLKDVKMVILVAGGRVGTVDRVMNDVYLNNLLPEGYDFELRIFSEDTLSTDSATFQRFSDELKTSNIFLMVNPGVSTFTASLSTPVKLMPTGSKVYLLGGSNPLTTDIIVDPLAYSSVLNANLTTENIKRALLAALKKFTAIDSSTNTTIIGMPTEFVYHPDTTQIFTTRADYEAWYISSGKYKANGPWIGLLFHAWYYGANDLAAYNALINKLEESGANVIVPIFSDFATTANKFFMVNGTPAIDVLITHLHSGMTDNASLNILNNLNVPILSPVHVFLQDTLDGYLASSTGLYGGELTTWIITPEINGRSQPVLIGGSKSIGTDPTTGADIKIFVPYQPGIDQLADRAVSWGILKHKLNADKKLALIYFDNTHDEGMPTGGSLNIEASLANILKALAAEGYDVGPINVTNLTADSVLAMINDHGRNLVNYTQADLASLVAKGAPTITVAQYMQWYNQLPASLRAQVEETWGPAPGNLMIYDGKIVFPGIMIGNIFMGPQPIWKWNGNSSNLDNNTLPPTHQYIAFYLWLQDGFNADAVVHTGEHGTLELLPGHTSGMTEDDWPNTLIGEMPNIYIYSGANDNAKRRAYAVLISHLTPPVVESALYGNLMEMHDLLTSFDTAYQQNDTGLMTIYYNQIWKKINNETGLKERLGINSSTPSGTVLNTLHSYLHTLQQLLTPYGLHTFGELPDNETLEKFIAAIIAFDPGNRAGQYDYILNLLNQSVINEMASLLKALNGGYIKPGVAADPVRNLASLPTGTNTYSFDPRKVPDIAALTIGNSAAEAVLKEYLSSNNGTFPETMATSIRGNEVIITNGQSIATIFYLLGVEPVTLNNVVVGTKIIPLENMTITIGNVTMQRPRIDVLISASVSFINVCPNIIALIDNAIKQVAILNESSDKNYVRKHYLDMIPQLKTELLAQGLNQVEADTQAERLARARIFGLPPGADPHAMGTARILRSSETWTEEELAEAYLEYESYLYGDGLSGVPGRSVMEKLLSTVESAMVISPRITNGASGPTYRGITMIEFIIKQKYNRTITPQVVNTADPNNIIVRTLKEALNDDVTMTLLNPVWKDRFFENPASQRSIGIYIRTIINLNINHDISADTLQQIADTYVLGPNALTDPDALKMAAKSIYNAYKHGMMSLTSEQLKKLTKILGMDGIVPDSGNPSTPTNPSNPGTPSNPGATPSSPSASDSGSSSSVSPAVSASAASVATASEAGQQSGKSYEVSEKTKSSSKSNENYAYAIVGLIALMGLIGFGYFKGVGRN